MKTAVLREINKLPVSERILLAEKIWDGIPADRLDDGLTLSEKRVLDQRLTGLKNGTAKTVKWSEVRTEMRTRRKCR